MAKEPTQPYFLNLSVEEENLATIPFAVLERRVGKRTGKIEIRGTKTLPDGTKVNVLWQVQGNDELGLPTEQDLDIFVALGVLTFRHNFSKTVSFSGREIAGLLNMRSVHGKFYNRLKLAMDRFIPLRFRALAATDSKEEVKWVNVFQEASFSLDRTSGRCTGAVTWTDKLIQSMDSGFFRLLDAGRYMDLDGITAKHLYRFLAVAFENSDVVVIDARKLATEHLGIFKLPRYFSRLLQTLEPAFDQLIRIQVLGSYHVVSAEHWRVALHRHPSHVAEAQLLLSTDVERREESIEDCRAELRSAGFTADLVQQWCEAADTPRTIYALRRAAAVANQMRELGVLPHVAQAAVRQAIQRNAATGEGRELLDWCEIAVEVCRQKQASGQRLKNLPGLLMKIVKDVEARTRLVNAAMATEARQRYRQLEESSLEQQREAEERGLVVEYEEFRQQFAASLFQQFSQAKQGSLRKAKREMLSRKGRYAKIPPNLREQEMDHLILQDLAAKEAPRFEKWCLRKKAQQASLPFQEEEA